MIRRARSGLVRLVRWYLRRANLALVRLDNSQRGMAYVCGTCARLGVDLVLDIGANVGSTGLDLRRHGYAGKIVSFEPQSRPFQELQRAADADPRWECRRVALGEAEKSLPINVSGFSPSSSLLTVAGKHLEVWPHSATVGTEDVPVTRLDNLAGPLGLKDHKTLLKIDVQGYESRVLRGAADCLSYIRAAYVELLFSPLYEGQSKYYEVMAALEAAGLHFVGLFDTFPDPQTGYALYGDGLFIRADT